MKKPEKVLGEEIAAAMTEETATAAATDDTDPLEGLSNEERAAAVFQQVLPLSLKKIDELSGNQMRRVLKALFEAPLNQEKFKFVMPIEAEVYGMGMALMNTKFTMFQAAIAEQLAKERTEAVKEEVKNEESV